MKFLATWSFLLYIMLHFSSLVNSFDTSSEVKTPPSSKWLEPYRIYITDVDVDTIIYQCNAPNAPPVLQPRDMFTWKFRKDLFGENSSQDGAFFSKRNEMFWFQADDNWQLMHQWS
ncbi:hypothetical protein HanPSC8_Chr11g0484151 [Helianthus annuus]|nr:hypothetical protein HanPSC8_Chr11g0484151 [Helianthus annuus]